MALDPMTLLLLTAAHAALETSNRDIDLQQTVDAATAARDQAVAAARIKYPAGNHAAEAVVIYDLNRDGAYELSPPR